MEVTVFLFGNLVQFAGANRFIFKEITDTESINDLLISKFPDFKKVNYVIAVNQRIVKENWILKHGDELAFLPPFAGG